MNKEEIKATQEETVDEEKLSQEENVQEENVQEENVEEAENTTDNSEEKKDKKKKKDKKQEKIEKLEEEIKNLKDIDLRRQAEWENFRKRTEKEKSDMYTIGAKEIIEHMLPIIDNFERGLKEGVENDPFKEGMEMIYKQFLTTFEQIGVKEIPTDGEEFNPDLHNAVMQEEKEGFESGTITETFQKGYIYKERVVRHAMVKVAC